MITRSFLLIALLASTSIAGAEVYKWVDEDGNVHFTDTPPPKQKTEEVRIDRAATPSPARSHADGNTAGNNSDRDLCNNAIRKLSKFAPAWERQIRAKMPEMSAAEKQAADKALTEMKAGLRELRGNINECTKDMADAENRRKAECLANSPDADTAMFCVL